MPEQDSVNPDAPATALDAELASLRAQRDALLRRRANLASVLLSTPDLSTHLPDLTVTKAAKAQQTRNLTNTYRACAGITAYRVRDPDPCAVDAGNILGVRIEVCIDGKYIETYHVLFNRPSRQHKAMLKIHRHTIPACIPVAQLAARYLPQSRRDAEKSEEQDLTKFGRVLRRELVAWHKRTAALERLRAEAGLSVSRQNLEAEEHSFGKVLNAFVSDDEDEDADDDFVEREHRDAPVTITDIDSDFAVRQLQITWSNGQTAALDASKDGEIVKGLVRARDGARVAGLETGILGRLEGLVGRLGS